MIENAWRWAAARQLLRKSPIHGEEEATLVLSESFELLDEQGESMSMNGSIEMEDETGYLLQNDLPAVDADEADILRGNPAGSSSAGIVFPSLQQNASPLSILPAFLEVLGRKIDNIEDVVERLDGFDGARVIGPPCQQYMLRDQIKAALQTMKGLFDGLTKKQSEALTSIPD
ncbi:unnamed protein product, partial [Symbiodinium pilosum]